MPDSSSGADNTELSAENTAVEAPAAQGTPDSNAASSSAPQAGTMFDAVKSALEPKEVSPTSATPGDSASPADSDGSKTDQASDDDLSEEDLKGLHWKVQKRFKRFTDALKEKDAEIDALKPRVEESQKITQAIQQAGLDEREVSELFEIGALLRRDPQAALQKIVPVVQALQQAVGDVLPRELQERVRLGYLTEEDARALNRATADAHLQRQRLEQTETEQRVAREREQASRLVNSSVEAIERWEKQIADKDPDWPLKRVEVAEQVELAITKKSRELGRQYFPTPDEAVELSKAALKTVSERIKRFSPKPPEVRSATGGTSSSRSAAAPKTTLEAIQFAIGGAA